MQKKFISFKTLKNFFISINLLIRKSLIKFLITKHCGNSVVTGGEGATKNNCFWIGLLSNTNTYLLIDSYLNEELLCSKYENNVLTEKVNIKENELIKYEIEFVHHFKGYQIQIIGVYKFLIFILPNKFFVAGNYIYEKISQNIFNQRSLSSRRRYDFLKLLIDNFHSERNGFSYVEVEALLHSVRVFAHPQYNKEASKINALLVGLTDTKELKIINGNFHLTGHTFKSLDEYEESDRKHKSLNRSQIAMVFLTAGLLFVTFIQTKIIEVPTLIDLTKF